MDVAWYYGVLGGASQSQVEDLGSYRNIPTSFRASPENSHGRTSWAILKWSNYNEKAYLFSINVYFIDIALFKE